jgi:hypothetical protein
MPKFEQPGQNNLNFEPLPKQEKRWDFIGDYTAGDRQLLASRISNLLSQGIKTSDLTEEEQAFYKWQKEVFKEDDSQPKWR